jgi:hypothetical protein
MKTSRSTTAVFLAFGVLVSTISLLAQMPVTNRTILLAMAMNAKKMTQYQWKQRVNVVRKGNPSEPIIEQIRFDSTGQMQRTTISAPEQKEMRGVRGRIAAGVKENVKEIMQLAASYNKPQQMMEAVKKAQISPSSNGGPIQLRATGLIKPTDSMTMLLNPATHLATHLDINTDYDGGPMTIAQDYSPLPGGPNVMRSMKVSVPNKNIVVNVGSYDYTRPTARAIE